MKALQDKLDFSLDLAIVINDLFMRGEFNEVDKMILGLDFKKLNSTAVVCWCRFTCCAEKQLKKYDYLIEKSKKRLEELGKDVNSLMVGLI